GVGGGGQGEEGGEGLGEHTLLAHEAVHQLLRRGQQAFDVGREGALDPDQTGGHAEAEPLGVEPVRAGRQEIHLPEIRLERDRRKAGGGHQRLGGDEDRGGGGGEGGGGGGGGGGGTGESGGERRRGGS